MILKPVTFKVGEVFGYDGEISKATALALVDPDAPLAVEEKTKKPKKNAD